jgi:integrase
VRSYLLHPEDGTTVRGNGHTNHRENGAYTLEEVKQFLKLFPAGSVAVAIGINAFLALRKPEVEALSSDDYDQKKDRIRIHRTPRRAMMNGSRLWRHWPSC